MKEDELNEIGGREFLEKLSRSNKFVFHGSPYKLDQLTPQQQTRYNKQTKQSEPDGEPAVCATPYHEIAIFRALTSKSLASALGVKNYFTGFGDKDGKPLFWGNPQSIAIALRPESVGFVYVFNKKDFRYFTHIESRAYHKVDPVYTIEVTSSDLPDNIEIIQEVI